jgi:hypothetical protein
MSRKPSPSRKTRNPDKAKIDQALERVRHPLYVHLIAVLVDSMTLQIAAVERTLETEADPGFLIKGHFDG